MTKDEIAAAFPLAVAKALELKAVFGDGVRILKATAQGQPDLVSAAHHVAPVPQEPPQQPAKQPSKAHQDGSKGHR